VRVVSLWEQVGQLGSLTLTDLILDELRMRGAHLIPESSYQPDTRGQTCRRSSHEGGVAGGAETKGGASEMRAALRMVPRTCG
jgi:hypothetical protein